jgi:DNA-binding MarR family transcriptional regulator
MATPETATRSSTLSEGGVRAWKAFLRANSRLTADLDQQLRREHGIALGDLDVLIQLSESPGGLRMCDLAHEIVLSPSGLSRRVDRLERDGLVARRRAKEDGRTVETRLTADGKRILTTLRKAHRAAVKERFADHFSAAELESLADLLERLTPSERA